MPTEVISHLRLEGGRRHLLNIPAQERIKAAQPTGKEVFILVAANAFANVERKKRVPLEEISDTQHLTYVYEKT